ncbi:glycosyltransferase family 9 protein [Ideonella sp.]|uniref:glycosyltransferase family 9 protein n=1 Tax=Ideonella sp. TaxID=1929293 RepID=UPI0035B29B87
MSVDPVAPAVLRALTAPVERIAVFRALMLGDLLCAVPAWRAVRAAWPSARITLVGLAWARPLAERLSCIDDFIELPGFPGLPEVPCDVRRLPDALAQLQARRFDLALQMHGSGEVVNPLVACFGARHMAAFARPGVWRPAGDEELCCAWPEQGHEIERLLALTDHLGLPRQGTSLEFPVGDDDRRALRAAWPAVDGPAYVCVHPGSQLPSRRWDPRRFAAVADALADRGLRVVLTGSAPEAGLVADVRACMRHTPVDLCGRTDLWSLGALLERARLLVCNDTGLSHIAAALRVPSVVVSCGSDVARWAPLDTQRHRVLAEDMACRPCGHRVCPHEGHPCAQAVMPDAVLRAALRQLGAVCA